MRRATLLCLIPLGLAACGSSETRTVTQTRTLTVTATVAAAPPKKLVGKRPAKVTDDGLGTKLAITLLGFEDPAKPTNGPVADTVIENAGGSPSKYRWARAQFRVKNLGSKEASINYEHFRAVDASGQRYTTGGSSPPVFAPGLEGESVAPGESVTGYIGVPVPKATRITSVRFTPVDGTGSVSWRV